MGDVTISESHYNRLKDSDAKQRAEARAAREEAEAAGIGAWKAGRKSEGLAMIGGANMPALKAIFGGAVVYYVATGEWFNKIQLFLDHWWLTPLLVMGLGYWMFRRQSPWAAALLSAGAAMLVQAYRASPKKDDGKDTKGVDDDAGRWDWSEDTYGARGRWVETPSGGRTFLKDSQGAHAGERVAERVFEHVRAA